MCNLADPGVLQAQSIIRGTAGWLCRKTSGKECFVEQVSRAVARECAPGAVPPVSGWCQSDNQQTCAGVPERWYRASPIGLIPKLSAFFLSDVAYVNGKSGAARAGDYPIL